MIEMSSELAKVVGDKKDEFQQAGIPADGRCPWWGQKTPTVLYEREMRSVLGEGKKMIWWFSTFQVGIRMRYLWNMLVYSSYVFLVAMVPYIYGIMVAGVKVL